MNTFRHAGGVFRRLITLSGGKKIPKSTVQCVCFSAKANIEESPTGLTLTDSCVEHLKKLADSEEFLRVTVEGGGCSGFSYKFELDKVKEEDDITFSRNGAQVVTDVDSLELIKGSKIDYEIELIKSSFRVIGNPQSTLIGKLDYQTVRVDLGGALPSQKRMKKRRELDALIGNRVKRETQGGEGQVEYDSLNSSLSSPTPDAYMPSNYYTASRRVNRTSGGGCGCTFRRMIRICLPVCFLSLVAACITACIAIVWLQVNLKTDVDKLKEHVTKLETWQAEQPSAVDDMKRSMAGMVKDINEIEDGENGIKSLAQRLALLTEKFEEQVSVPSQKLDQLKSDSDAIRTKLEELESAVKELKSQSAEMKTSEGLLSASYSDLKNTVDEIKAEMSSSEVKQLQNMVSSKQIAKDEISKLNATVLQVSHNLTLLDNKIEDVRKKTSKELYNMQGSVDSLKQKFGIGKNPENSNRPVSTTTTTVYTSMNYEKSDSERNEVPKKPSLGLTVSTKTAVLANILKDIKLSFESLDSNKDQYLSQNELTARYGERVPGILLKYDSNKDGSLSKSEVESFGTRAKRKGDSESMRSVSR